MLLIFLHEFLASKVAKAMLPIFCNDVLDLSTWHFGFAIGFTIH